MSFLESFEIEALKQRIKQLEAEFDAVTNFRPKLKVKKLRPEAVVPQYQTPDAAGLDLVGLNEVTIPPGYRGVIETGLAIELPRGWEAQVRPRSGLALKQGITVLNSPGTIDSDYRGEVKVIVINHGLGTVHLKAGERVAQLVVARAPQALVSEVQELSETNRGAGGFGSTGK